MQAIQIIILSLYKRKNHTKRKKQNYSQDNIEALSESIIVNGLRHNLSVIPDATSDLYRIVSGERRYHAINMMEEKHIKNFFQLEFHVKLKNQVFQK
ncbi:hypothetical protein C823_007945 [Eubacterium plexicaudatum ASF492]|nr:hypothetical protein C823_007945 [Eubacterium plexicaudatum ASF492]